MTLLSPLPFRSHNDNVIAMKRSQPSSNRIDNLAAFARLMQDMDPEVINAATRAERHRIAALIELQEGPGRFLP